MIGRRPTVGCGERAPGAGTQRPTGNPDRCLALVGDPADRGVAFIRAVSAAALGRKPSNGRAAA
jgi:hypothetical protein